MSLVFIFSVNNMHDLSVFILNIFILVWLYVHNKEGTSNDHLEMEVYFTLFHNTQQPLFIAVR